MNKEFLVISHTHWDREWYVPFEKFRIRLLDLVNNLLKILEDYPSYIFHFDAQTIVLEDYLAVYPEKEELLKKYIRAGNIVIGPWYVQNDFFLSSGEATIRNVLIGRKIAKRFGKCADVAYTPDQFGLPSQLPQILKKLGMENHLFGRGYAFYEDDAKTKIPQSSEFYWEASDGSRVFSVLMPFWYNNAQRFSKNISKSVAKIEKAENNFDAWSNSPYLLMMNGVDHLEAQNDLLPVLEKVNEKLKDRTIYQANMEESLSKIKPYASDKTIKGELRNGTENDILTGTFSTRVDIKKLNFDMQNMIEHKIEPLYSMIMFMGAKDIYPQNEINYMWKVLIPNHAHDSICCCSNGNVMKHMADRYLSLNEIGEELISRGCRFINHHISRSFGNDNEYYLTIINTSQQNFTGVIDLVFDINVKDAQNSFDIISCDNKKIPFVIIDKEECCHATFSPLNLPGEVEVVRYKVQAYFENIPSFGYTNYVVKPSAKSISTQESSILENEYIKVDIEDSKVKLYDKVNNLSYNDILSFEDIGDAGDSYVFTGFKNDIPVKAELINVEVLYANHLKSKVQLEYTVKVPYTKNEAGRSGVKVTNKIFVELSLGKGEKQLNVDVKIENNSKYHLLRALINTGISDDISYASSVFDVIKRNDNDIIKIRNHTQPVNGFVYKKGDGRGLAVFTRGLYEYENSDKEIIKLSLLRSVDMITQYHVKTKEWVVEDNLMQGTTCVSFALMPFDGNDTSIPVCEQNINSQPLYWFDSVDTHMFIGGSPVVQDGDVDEVYFADDKYADLNMPATQQFVNISEKVCVTALKKAEEDNAVICRMYNPSEKHLKNIVTVNEGQVIEKTDLKEEERIEFKNEAQAKEIISIFL